MLSIAAFNDASWMGVTFLTSSRPHYSGEVERWYPCPCPSPTVSSCFSRPKLMAEQLVPIILLASFEQSLAHILQQGSGGVLASHLSSTAQQRQDEQQPSPHALSRRAVELRDPLDSKASGCSSPRR